MFNQIKNGEVFSPFFADNRAIFALLPAETYVFGVVFADNRLFFAFFTFSESHR